MDIFGVCVCAPHLEYAVSLIEPGFLLLTQARESFRLGGRKSSCHHANESGKNECSSKDVASSAEKPP